MSKNPIEQSLIGNEPLAEDQQKHRGKRLRAVWSNGHFRRLLIGQFISSMGDWFIIGVLIPTVMALSGGSALAVSGIMAAKLIPALIVNPYVSVFTENLSNRRTMIAADLARAIIVLFLIGTNSLAFIYVVVFFMESASVFFFPARNSLVPQLVPDEDELNVARAVLFAATQLGLVTGLIFSGALIAVFEAVIRFIMSLDVGHYFTPLFDALSPILFSAQAGFIINSLTFLFSALILYRLADDVVIRKNEQAPGITLEAIKKNTSDVLGFIKKHVEFRRYIITVLIVLMGAGAIVPVGLEYLASLNGLPPFADQLTWLTDFRGARYTFFLSFLGIGVVLGALASQRLEKRFSKQTIFPFAVGAFGVLILIFSLSVSIVFASIIAGLAGFCLAVIVLAVVRYILSEMSESQTYRVLVVIDPLVRLSILLSLLVVVPFSSLLSLMISQFTHSAAIWGVSVYGPRFTLIVSSVIILGAAAFAFKSLYFDNGKTKKKGTDEAGTTPPR